MGEEALVHQWHLLSDSSRAFTDAFCRGSRVWLQPVLNHGDFQFRDQPCGSFASPGPFMIYVTYSPSEYNQIVFKQFTGIQTVCLKIKTPRKTVQYYIYLICMLKL